MSSVRNGVQALMKKEVDPCFYVQCFAQCLNLGIQEVPTQSELVSSCLAFISQLVKLIRCSLKRLYLFKSIWRSVTLSEDKSVLSLQPFVV